MLKTGLSHGVALVPNPPKERYYCPFTGAHFEFSDICEKLGVIALRRDDELIAMGIILPPNSPTSYVSTKKQKVVS